jgi:tetraacyldisaccharide 4'-kinase
VKPVLFEDHHAFQPKDFNSINKKFNAIASTDKIIIVTEKDAARLVTNSNYPDILKPQTFSIPIRVKILHDQEDLFIQKIKNYVVEDSRNC